MKPHIIFIGLLLLAGFSFAQGISEQCAEACCESYNGDYQRGYGACSGLGTSDMLEYNECVKSCRQTAEALSCCGPSFLLAGLVGAVFVVRK